MRRRSVAEEWLDDREGETDAHSHDDGAAYIDAATVALRYQSVHLGSARGTVVGGEAPTPPAFRDAMGCMATGVCVVTTLADGEDVAMTANSLTSVSLDPPLLLVCIAKKSRFRKAILTTGRWGVSILDATAYDISSRFARPDRSRTGQFASVEHHRGETGVALLDASVATLQCLTRDVHPGGDHDIVVGEVKVVERRGPGAHPLIFHRGSYRWL